MTFVVGWTQHLVEVMPRWLRWGELVDRITRSAQQAFGWTYRPDTLAGIVEASPVWQDIETEAERELKRAQDIAALSAHHGNPHQVERGSGFQFEAD